MNFKCTHAVLARFMKYFITFHFDRDVNDDLLQCFSDTFAIVFAAVIKYFLAHLLGFPHNSS